MRIEPPKVNINIVENAYDEVENGTVVVMAVIGDEVTSVKLYSPDFPITTVVAHRILEKVHDSRGRLMNDEFDRELKTFVLNLVLEESLWGIGAVGAGAYGWKVEVGYEFERGNEHIQCIAIMKKYN